jgi:3-dehydroquinate dehydratase-2
MLGSREPSVYGFETLEQIIEECKKLCDDSGVKFEHFQSNHEGEIVDFIQKTQGVEYFIANLGAFTHTSIAIRDAFLSIKTEKTHIIELHISNIFKRESFRHQSFISDIATAVISGLGTQGYALATKYCIDRILKKT